MKKILILIMIAFGTSCSRVQQGEAGIVTSFNGSIDSDLRTGGFEVVVFDSMQTIDLTQNIIIVNNVAVRDLDGIALTEFDANITFNTNAEKVIDFYKKTKSIGTFEDENGHKNTVLGYNIIKLELINELQKAVASFKSKDITANRANIETKVKEELARTLNGRFGNVFDIVNVKVNKVLLDPSIEKSLQLVQVTRNQQLEVQAQIDQVKLKKELLDADLRAKSEVASKYGISMKEYLELEIKRDFNKALEKSGSNVQLHLTK
jgi:uncharacterized glyoxalase superfamily protein PhnB